MRIALPSLAASLLAAACSVPHDMVVYGGTASGVIAAVQGARAGHRVVLVAPHRHLGGMTTSGLGATDVGEHRAVGGLAREFYRRLRQHYAADRSWVHEAGAAFRGRGQRAGEDTAWTFEPHVAEAVLEQLLRQAGVATARGERLDLLAGVERQGSRIVAIHTLGGRRFAGRVFIDATYEGDLLAAAGVRWTSGREANATFGETLNGVQTARAVHHQFVVDVDPYATPGDPASGLLPGIESTPLAADGDGDGAVQAYCFRLCTTDVAANRRPWTEPPGYDAADYELLLRNFEAGDHRVPWNPVWLPNRKTDTNNNFAVSTDYIGASRAYVAADWPARDALLAAHERYQRGLLWTLAENPRVPEAVRAQVRRLGLARDEFVDNDNWPYQIYVREARRMVSDVVMTELHCRGDLRADDPVGLGSYGMDSHHVRRYVDDSGHVRNEGDVQVHGFRPYGISYRALRPRRAECTNLLVPVCVSATHIAFGSIRMEPVFMVLGQSAAIAAGLAIERDCAVQDVPYQLLRARLLAADQVLSWPAR